MKKRIVVKGPALSRSGYGAQARFAIEALRSREELFDIFIVNIPWGTTGNVAEQTAEMAYIKETMLKTQMYVQQGGQFDMSLQITVPNEFAKIAPINIGYTAGIETTKVSPQWLVKSNQCVDSLIVVSNHSKKVFENTSYTGLKDNAGNEIDNYALQIPVQAVNYPVHVLEPSPVDITFTTDKNFIVVSQWGPRKNVDNTIQWFVEHFKDDETVGLVLKTNTASDSIMDREHTARRLDAVLSAYPDRKCKIYLLHGELTASELTWLYRHPTMKALINIGHGEGYGLPLFEAAYNGLSLITTTWSGQMDFICKQNKKGKAVPRVNRVDFDLAQVQPYAVWPGIIEADSKWCFPREASFKRALQNALDKEAHYQQEAETLQKHLLESFTKARMYSEFVNCIYNPSQEELEWAAALGEIEMI